MTSHVTNETGNHQEDVILTAVPMVFTSCIQKSSIIQPIIESSMDKYVIRDITLHSVNRNFLILGPSIL